MDQDKVIHAYFSGFITIDECAQILGMDLWQVSKLIAKFLDKAKVN